MSKMTKPVSTGTALALLAAIALVGLATAQAKQQCSTAAGHKGYWSWRMIDDRKCWYEGKPMLSKAMLAWADEAPAAKAPAVKAEADDAAASAAPAIRRNPMDAQARVRDDDPGTFDALWRDRIGIEQRQGQ
jgi:hypothetical protein